MVGATAKREGPNVTLQPFPCVRQSWYIITLGVELLISSTLFAQIICAKMFTSNKHGLSAFLPKQHLNVHMFSPSLSLLFTTIPTTKDVGFRGMKCRKLKLKCLMSWSAETPRSVGGMTYGLASKNGLRRSYVFLRYCRCINLTAVRG